MKFADLYRNYKRSEKLCTRKLGTRVTFFFLTIVKVLSCWYEALVILWLLGWQREMSIACQSF
jgi:hypothetical protein